MLPKLCLTTVTGVKGGKLTFIAHLTKILILKLNLQLKHYF